MFDALAEGGADSNLIVLVEEPSAPGSKTRADLVVLCGVLVMSLYIAL